MTDFQIQEVHCNPLYIASQGVSIQGGPLERVQIFSLLDRGPPPQKMIG